MKIQELAQQSGVSSKTIRYYEDIGLLPPPSRAENRYRVYSEQDIERLRLVAGARRLDLSLDDIREILAMRDRRQAPCRLLLERIEQKAAEIDERIRDLQRLESELHKLHTLGLTFSP
jgi:DNA-binding transcriptional MerR regulator